jgi:hypothetical protein
MPVLTFRCPTTRRHFDSGVRLDERSATISRLNRVRVVCPQCRREHRFLLADGLLELSDPQPDVWALAERRILAEAAGNSDLVSSDAARIACSGRPAHHGQLSECAGL